MTRLEEVIAKNRQAVVELLDATDRNSGVWTMARAPGKWSPAQLVEHLARAYEESAHVAAGRPSKLPALPAFIRPVVRGVFFNRVVRSGKFPKAKTNRAMDPEGGPADAAAGRRRLLEALEKFETACRALDVSGQPLASAVFGRVAVADYVKFQEHHTRHHRKQLPG